MATITQKVSSCCCYSLIKLINLYQYVISPCLGNQCRFFPNCSCYAQTALQEYGLLKGIYLSIKRLLRCQPWHEGGYDPIVLKAKTKLSKR